MTDETRTEIAAAISSLVGDREDGDAVLKLAVVAIGNVLFRHHRKNGNWRELFTSNEGDLRHVVDWLAVAHADGDEWIARTDSKGRPLKLAKMHSVDQIKAEADKAFNKRLQKAGVKALLTEDETLEIEMEDGYSVVKMLSPSALDRESTLMQHCVGIGSYDRHLQGSRIALYSLRDQFNKPHATMEVDLKEGVLLQIRGKQNGIPTPRYLRLLGPFLKAMDFNRGELANSGFVVDANGAVHHISEIPDNTRFSSSLRLVNIHSAKVPSGVRVDGNLMLDNTSCDILRRPARVAGDVSASGVVVMGIHPEFVFGGGLELEGSRGTLLPPLHIKGNLNLKETVGYSLSPGTRIEGNLNLILSDMRRLPDDLVVMGDLLVSGSSLEELPKGMSVGGSLFLTDTKSLDKIPDGMKIGGNILLRGSSLRSIGHNVSVAGMISMDSDKIGTLTVKPDLEVSGGFFLRDSNRTPGARSQISVEELIAASASAETPVSPPLSPSLPTSKRVRGL